MTKRSLREEYGEGDEDDDLEGEPRITCTYEIVTPESAADGDVAERGFEDEDGQSMLPEDDDDEDVTVASNAVKFLKDNGATEPSSSQWHAGLWYSTPDADIDHRTGEATYHSYHLVDFAPEEEREVFDLLHSRPRGRR